jgi:hypothetical protein
MPEPTISTEDLKRIHAYAAEQVALAPPLSVEQRAVLARLLGVRLPSPAGQG